MILGMSMSAFAFAHIAEYFHEDGAVFLRGFAVVCSHWLRHDPSRHSTFGGSL
jgi:hypothetical protein